MANQLYPKGAEHILDGSIDFLTDTIKILFYHGSFVSTDSFVSDLVGGSINARSSALSGITTTNGLLDANDITLLAVPAGPSFTHVILYKDTGADATSPLIVNWDITAFTPTGTDVNVVFNPSGLFSIA